MRLDVRDRRLHAFGGVGVRLAAGERRVGEVRPTQIGVKRERDQRDDDQDQRGGDPPRRRGFARAALDRRRRARGDQPPRRLGARRRRLPRPAVARARRRARSRRAAPCRRRLRSPRRRPPCDEKPAATARPRPRGPSFRQEPTTASRRPLKRRGAEAERDAPPRPRRDAWLRAAPALRQAARAGALKACFPFEELGNFS